MFDYLLPLLSVKTAAIVVVSTGIAMILLSDGTKKDTAILAAGFSFAGIMLSVFASRGLT
ncbi:hypothetical protein F9K94_21640 [Brucella tritici]|uniref:Uncharacterized protein n=1 Tax=Brucella tritici TaxID=94626 RepID=A0A7V7VR21_9HYPH|nr:hypothetical protein [Brucella tritici]KAB2655157.1 hypothetical protein F9K94_21640 [Brucella tritici]